MQLPKYENEQERDQLAKNYMYTTSTQEYELLLKYCHLIINLIIIFLFISLMSL